MSFTPLIRALRGKRIVVLGDMVADEYVFGETSRVSREAPVLVVRYVDQELRLGGAANAAHNVRDLSGVAIPVGVIGRDAAGERVSALLKGYGIPTRGLVATARATTTKTRILAGALHTTKQQVMRLDREDAAPLTREVEQALIARLNSEVDKADALLVSDYGLGLMTPRLVAAVQKLARKGAIVCVDSRFNLRAYVGVTALTPNEPEAEAASGRELRHAKDVEWAGRLLLAKVKAQAVLITRGRQGMALFEPKEKTLFVPISGADEVADVTGAGDTVIAAFTLALAAGADFAHAARLANFAASVTVMKAGAATVSPAELARAAG
jgi:rfaE bifunctional protein kinase chain/domain